LPRLYFGQIKEQNLTPLHSLYHPTLYHILLSTLYLGPRCCVVSVAGKGLN